MPNAMSEASNFQFFENCLRFVANDLRLIAVRPHKMISKVIVEFELEKKRNKNRWNENDKKKTKTTTQTNYE